MPSTNPNVMANLTPFVKSDPRIRNAKKGTVHLSTHIHNLLEDEAVMPYLTHIKEAKDAGTPIKAIVTVAIIKAAQGDVRWADLLFKYGYGQKLNIETTDGDKVTNVTVDAEMLQKWQTFLANETKIDKNKAVEGEVISPNE